MRSTIDRLLSIPSEVASSQNPDYLRYSKARRFMEAGAALLLGGFVAHATGLDIGEVAGVDVAEVAGDVAMGIGFVTAYFSIFPVTEGAIKLADRDP